MHADLSRGHEPDRARGREYRRVLPQAGRPVLDSDLAALVDALLGVSVETTRGLGCAAGSPDLGFLVTPGRLVTLFAEVAGRHVVAAGAGEVHVDHRRRLHGRFPGVRVAGSGALTRVLFPALDPGPPGGGDVVATLWAWAPTATTMTVAGSSVAVTAGGTSPRPVPVTIPAGLETIEIGLSGRSEVWLFLLEERRPAGEHGTFAVAAGTYHVDGLVVRTPGGDFPGLGFPEDAGFTWVDSPAGPPPLPGLVLDPAPGQRAVAYLEVWERHIGPVEDPGLREVALGGVDTATRSQLLGQVKTARVVGALTPDEARAAIGSTVESGGTLTVATAAGSVAADPCDLPDPGGYSGSDNRLYRIQVHRGGGLTSVRLTWSRDNGSELFPASLNAEEELVVDADSPLAGGDVVEVLDDVTDLGDEALAEVSAGGLVPPERAVGLLGRLVAVSTAGDESEKAFTLADVDDLTQPSAVEERFKVPGVRLKLRRWQGVVDPQRAAGAGSPTTGPHVLEDGITVTLSATGTYRAGQWWAYEARAGGAANGRPWDPAPHGPKRWFAPLALLEAPASPGTEPWQVVAWLDERFPHLCGITADDVSYDGDRAGADAGTVQEALDDLYDRLPDPATWPTVTGISWRNDRLLPLADFLAGIEVEFSEAMHPETASTSSFVVTLEAPAAPAALGRAFQPLILDGEVRTTPRQWRFVPAMKQEEFDRLAAGAAAPLRCRVRLAGEVILDRSGTRALDGQAVGRVEPDGYGSVVDLRLPSGDGRRGGDFSSWFFLERTPSDLVRVESVDPPRNSAVRDLDAILVTFSGPVRFDSVSRAVEVRLVRDEVVTVRGTLSAHPFENAPVMVRSVTFTPEDLSTGDDWVDVDVRIRGTGERPVVDSRGRPIDAAGLGTPSDLEYRFRWDVL